MTKLHDRTFGVDAVDRERDATLAARMAALQFVRPEHLEVCAACEGVTSPPSIHLHILNLRASSAFVDPDTCLQKCKPSRKPGNVQEWAKVGESGRKV